MFGERPVEVTALRVLQQLFVAVVEHNFFLGPKFDQN